MKKKYNVEVEIKEYEEKLRKKAELAQEWIKGYKHAINFVHKLPWYRRLFNLFR